MSRLRIPSPHPFGHDSTLRPGTHARYKRRSGVDWFVVVVVVLVVGMPVLGLVTIIMSLGE